MLSAEAETAIGLIRAEPAGALVACDFDGTLAPIVTLAQDARADPEAVAALAGVARVARCTVVLTGRPALVAVEYGGLAAVPRLVVLGHYGLERWEAGRLVAPAPDPAVAAARAELPPFADGVYVEEKGLSFVVHTRTAQHPEHALAQADPVIRAVAAAHGLEVVDGSFAREVRPRGTDKGTALLALAAQVRPAVLLVLGDDDGDLPAVDAVAALRARGVPGLVVCAARDGGSAALRERADVVVDGVAGVASFLRQIITSRHDTPPNFGEM